MLVAVRRADVAEYYFSFVAVRALNSSTVLSVSLSRWLARESERDRKIFRETLLRICLHKIAEKLLELAL